MPRARSPGVQDGKVIRHGGSSWHVKRWRAEHRARCSAQQPLDDKASDQGATGLEETDNSPSIVKFTWGKLAGVGPKQPLHIYVPGNVQGQEVNFLYDTGAIHTFVDVDIWEQIPELQRPELRAPDRKFLLADGRPLEVLGQAPMELIIDEQKLIFPVWIGRILDQAILGLDLLEKYQCHWDWNKKRMLFGRLCSKGAEEVPRVTDEFESCHCQEITRELELYHPASNVNY